MKRIYKTEKGFFKNQYFKIASIEHFFKDECFFNDGKQRVNAIASDELKSIIADRFIERNFGCNTPLTRQTIKNALLNGNCDLSYLQSFFTNGSNTLGGPHYKFCKLGFINSIYTL